MKKLKENIVPIVLGVLCAAIFLIALSAPRLPGDTVAAASRMERKLSARLSKLEQAVLKGSDNLPEDMVVYRYSADTLVSWVNQFPIFNDDITLKYSFQRLSHPQMGISAPLAGLGEDWLFCNLGSKWYLAKKSSKGDETVVQGLEIMDPQRLGLGERYSVKPLTFSGGTAVVIDGIPQFKVLYDSLTGTATADARLVWCAFALFLIAAWVFLFSSRTLSRAVTVSLTMFVVMVAMFAWSYTLQDEYRIFSPTLYSGVILHSIGSVLIVNMAIALLSFNFYVVREDISRRIKEHSRKLPLLSVSVLFIVAVFAYAFFSIRSINLNSSVSLEIYKMVGLTHFGLLVFISYLLMFLSVPLFVETFLPSVSIFSNRFRLIYSVLISSFIIVTAAIQGFQKEQDRLSVWANRLAIERDIALELQLRRVEQQLSSDILIPALSQLDNAAALVQNRLTDAYFFREAQNYNISVYLISGRSLPQERAFCSERLVGNEAIAPNSRFSFHYSPSGHSRYDGVFVYYSEQLGLLSMMVELEPKPMASNQGYSSLLGISGPGKVNIPPQFSYAKYNGNDLVLYHGACPYPTKMDDRLFSGIYSNPRMIYQSDSYRHFAFVVSDNEAVIISRPSIRLFSYLIAIVFVSLIMYLLLSMFSLDFRRRKDSHKAYFKNRIRAVLLVSLSLALVAMASVSVVFVIRSNETNMERIMLEKIVAIQSMVGGRLGPVASEAEFRGPEFMKLLQGVAQDAATDVTIFSPDGKLLSSSASEVFERMLLGGRMDSKAYQSIIREHKRYYIGRERIGRKRYFNMYTPLMGESGQIQAIICSPYTESGFNFERDAILHAMELLTVFIVLLLLATLMEGTVLERMFQPLSEMKKKMESANLDSLEQVQYNREDEISALVQSYNMMVSELGESTRKLALAERDKAWSGMARQVAHEIKNPLTPMKLQLQRIMRLKEKNDPSWQEKFDEMTKVLLDHIDILSDTANEFSSFAKLYTEDPVEINLDQVLQEEIAMFDNKDGIQFEYIGFQNAIIHGPKPQLTRVFVNLINNAVQALEGRSDGRIVVSLRKNSQDGFYDIVFEDNGPGVSQENCSKLFSPNFTTKNGGSGLGLAISRSVLQRCNATITYSKSFTLGGACFTIVYPI